jgi:hypothetical protein
MPGATPIAGKLKAIPCPRHIRSLHTQHDGLSTPGLTLTAVSRSGERWT